MSCLYCFPEFTCAVLQECGPGPFATWSQPVTIELIVGSTKHPLLPGFYKMLKEDVGLCQKLSLFDVDLNRSSGVSEPKSISQYVKQLCTSVLKEYLLEVLVACRRYTVSCILALSRAFSRTVFVHVVVYFVPPISVLIHQWYVCDWIQFAFQLFLHRPAVHSST